VELRGAHDRGRDRAGQHGALVRLLGGAVAGGEAVSADDRDDDDPPHARARADLLQVPRRRGEEVGRGLLLG